VQKRLGTCRELASARSLAHIDRLLGLPRRRGPAILAACSRDPQHPRDPLPVLLNLCIPSRASKPPVGPQWIHEIKHDGYRLIARKRGGRVRLFTRRGYDWTDRYPLIRKAVAGLQATSAVIDGEAVCCDDAGMAIFEKLHSGTYDDQAFLYAFDLLELDSEDWRPRPLDERKARLQKLLAGAANRNPIQRAP